MYSLHPEVTNIVEETIQIRYKAVYNYIQNKLYIPDVKQDVNSTKQKI